MTNGICQMKYDECNMPNEIWWMQYDECNMKNVMWQIHCYNCNLCQTTTRLIGICQKIFCIQNVPFDPKKK